MKYDAESGKIHIDLREFVTLASRSLSTFAAKDEDEPTLSALTAKRLSKIIGEHKPERLYYSFSFDGYDFELSPTVDALSENGITLGRRVGSAVGKPDKEELKTIRAEAFILGYILCETMGYGKVSLRIITISEVSDLHTEIKEDVEKDKLSLFFSRCVKVISQYARPEIERVTERLPTMKALKFPYKNIREGQSIFVRSAYRTLARGGVLYASAPTGTGKTVSALYPALRTLGDGRCEKVFYLTPKTTTADAARECLELFAKNGAKIRAVILSAKDKCCTGNHACREAKKNCKNAASKRLIEATFALYDKAKTVISAKEVVDVSLEYEVCPYELELSYSELCDVIICDFNYLFDPTVYIRRFFNRGGSYAFLIDEAHNLGERAREMFSAEITSDELLEISSNELLGPHSAIKKLSISATTVFRETLYPFVKDELRKNKDEETIGAATLSDIPSRLFVLFDELISVCEEEIKTNLPSKDTERDARVRVLRDFYHKIKNFSEALARFDSSYKLFIFFDDGLIRARLFCLDTGPEIKRRLALGHGAVLFSATLSPLGYYREILGGERSDEVLEVNSPFTPEQLSVSIMDKISTRYSEREDTLLAVVRAIAATVSAKRGNYIVFTPSFEYNEALSEAFKSKYPNLNVITQTKNMTFSEKKSFLQEFRREDASYLIGFCVMGGIYAEGIDLVGDSLIGAVIVGIGMPSLSYEREAIAEYYQEKYEEGKQYAYIYPGMNRVFQAAGRVIRTENDRGVIVLIDDRFDDPIYKDSLPKLWQGVRFIDNPKRLKEVTEEFWKENKED